MSKTVQIPFALSSTRYDEADDRWRAQVAELIRSLRVETDAVRVQRTAVPGTKGTVSDFVLALGEAGVFTTALEVIRAWLGRDKTRTIELDYLDGDGHEQHLSVSATNADPATLAPVIAAVAEQISDQP